MDFGKEISRIDEEEEFVNHANKCDNVTPTETARQSNESEIYQDFVTIKTKKRVYRYSNGSCLYKKKFTGGTVYVYYADEAPSTADYPINLEIDRLRTFQKGVKRFAMKMIEYEKGKVQEDEIEQDVEMLKINTQEAEKAGQNEYEQEIKMLESVDSDCVISLHDSYRKDTATHTQYYLFTELLSTGNLVEFSNRGEVTMKFQVPWPLRKSPLEIRILPELEIRIILIQIAEGLSALHKKGIIHRDIKPQNIFAKHEGPTIFGVIARVGDLGCAIPFQKESDCAKYRWTKKKAAEKLPMDNEPISAKFRSDAGTNGYKAPEVEDSKKYSRKADIWSLGVVLHEMYYGKKPPEMEDFVRQSHDTAIELNDLLEKMLVVDPAKRIGISDLLTDPFLQPGYWQLRLWRIELRYIITLSLCVNETIKTIERLTKQASWVYKIIEAIKKIFGKKTPKELMIPTVQKLCIWAMGYDQRNQHNIKDLVQKCSKEFPPLMDLMTCATEFPILIEQQKINPELSIIIGWIQEDLEEEEKEEEEKESLFHYKTMSPIQKKLFNLLLTAKLDIVGNDDDDCKKGGDKFLHSILFGQILELCYCEECLELLSPNSESENTVIALEWENKFDKKELAEKREQFWGRLLETEIIFCTTLSFLLEKNRLKITKQFYKEGNKQKLNSSATTPAEMHIFFEAIQPIPMFLRKKQFTFSYIEFFDFTMITTRIKANGNAQRETNFYLEISMLAPGHYHPENYGFENMEEIQITYLRFQRS